MGQLTVFEKDNCVYCKRVVFLLESIMRSIYEEIKPELPDVGMRFEDILSLKKVDINSDPAYAALCIRITGSFTVPHVFYNDIYIGDATKFNCCLEKANNLRQELANTPVQEFCPCVYSHIKELILKEIHAGKLSKDFDFPPHPAAQMVKVTETLAFSSLPTTKQLENLKSFGFKSVVNIVKTNSPAFNPEERTKLEETGIIYKHLPLYVFSEDSIWALLKTLWNILDTELQAPVLLHDDRGKIAGILVLFVAAKDTMVEMKNSGSSLDEATVFDMFWKWLNDLSLLFPENKFEETIRGVLRKIIQKVSSPNRSLQEDIVSTTSDRDFSTSLSADCTATF